jgi:hypothetical protein
MKHAEQTKTQPTKGGAKASRDATAVRPVKETPAPRPARPDGSASAPLPDLTAFGVDQRDAQTHIAQCEPCGRAHRHVVKNPKDAMALQSFGRNISVCLAGKQAKSPA